MEEEAPSISTLPAEKALLSPEETSTDPEASPADEPETSSILPDLVVPTDDPVDNDS
jgi:hypothetical protein